MSFDLGSWLYDEVGLGAAPKKRKAFFAKLVRLVSKWGQPVLATIATVWEEAQTRKDRSPMDHYFCRAVKLRLSEMGMYHETTRYMDMPMDDLIATAFKSTKPLPLFPDQTQRPKRAPLNGDISRAELEAIIRQRVKDEDQRSGSPVNGQ